MLAPTTAAISLIVCGKNWLFCQGLGVRVTSHAEAACWELQVPRCIDLNRVAPLGELETSCCLEAIIQFLSHIISPFVAYSSSTSSSVGCKDKKEVPFTQISERLQYHSLPYTCILQVGIHVNTFSACSIKLSLCALCIISWPCLVKDS